MQCEDLQLSFLIKRGRKMLSVKRNLVIQDSIVRVKKEIEFCNNLSMQVNRLVEFHRKKYNLYKSHVYKIKTVI